MKIKVWHSKATGVSMFYRRDGKIFNQFSAVRYYKAGEYDKVGEIEVPFNAHPTSIDEYLEVAYEKTQNINGSWNHTKRCRSTSVGDILQIDEEIYIVSSFGFEKLEVF